MPLFSNISVSCVALLSFWGAFGTGSSTNQPGASLNFKDLSFPYRNGVTMYYSGYSISYDFIEGQGMEPQPSVPVRLIYAIRDAAPGGKVLQFDVTHFSGNKQDPTVSTWLRMDNSGMYFWIGKRKVPTKKQTHAISFPLERNKRWKTKNESTEITYACLALDSLIPGPLGQMTSFCIQSTWSKDAEDGEGKMMFRTVECYQANKGKIYTNHRTSYSIRGRNFTLYEEQMHLDSLSILP